MTLKNRQFSKNLTNTMRRQDGTDDGMAVIKDHSQTLTAPVLQLSPMQRRKFVSCTFCSLIAVDLCLTANFWLLSKILLKRPEVSLVAAFEKMKIRNLC